MKKDKSDEPVELCGKTTGSGDSVCFLPDEHSGSHQWRPVGPSLKAAVGAPRGRYDRVQAAYDGMAEDDQATFQEIIQDEEYSHAQVAEALREIGYDVDRKQVHQFREKLALGKVTL